MLTSHGQLSHFGSAPADAPNCGSCSTGCIFERKNPHIRELAQLLEGRLYRVTYVLSVSYADASILGMLSSCTFLYSLTYVLEVYQHI